MKTSQNNTTALNSESLTLSNLENRILTVINGGDDFNEMPCVAFGDLKDELMENSRTIADALELMEIKGYIEIGEYPNGMVAYHAKVSNEGAIVVPNVDVTINDILSRHTYTVKEVQVLVYLNNALGGYFGEESFSDVDIADIAGDIKLTKASVKGVIGSLVKKNVLGTWNTGTDLNNGHGHDVIYFRGQIEMVFEEPTAENIAKAVPTLHVVNKPAHMQATKKSTKSEVIITALVPYISKGDTTKEKLVEIACKACPEAALSTVKTIIADSKNPKYNKFGKLVVEDEKHIMSFAK